MSGLELLENSEVLEFVVRFPCIFGVRAEEDREANCRGPNDLSYLVARQQRRCKGIQAHVGITCYKKRRTF
jgi:hypothetical protein